VCGQGGGLVATTNLDVCNEVCKITAGYWPISDHFSKWPIKISAWCIHFVHMANKILEELEKWPTIIKFLIFHSAMRLVPAI